MSKRKGSKPSSKLDSSKPDKGKEPETPTTSFNSKGDTSTDPKEDSSSSSSESASFSTEHFITPSGPTPSEFPFDSSDAVEEEGEEQTPLSAQQLSFALANVLKQIDYTTRQLHLQANANATLSNQQAGIIASLLKKKKKKKSETDTSTPRLDTKLVAMISKPPTFAGDVESYYNFRSSLDSYMKTLGELFPTEETRIAFVTALFTGHAQVWYRSLENTKSVYLRTYKGFLGAMDAQFRDPHAERNLTKKLKTLRQGNQSIPSYNIEFHSVWNRTQLEGQTVVDMYMDSLNTNISDIISTYPEGDEITTMTEAFRLAIKAERALKNRPSYRNQNSPRRDKSTPPTTPTGPGKTKQGSANAPSKTGTTPTKSTSPRGPLTPEEKQRRIDQNLCLYCGEPNHSATDCPKRKNFRPTPTTGSTPSHTKATTSGKVTSKVSRIGKHEVQPNDLWSEEEIALDSGIVTSKEWHKSSEMQISIPIDVWPTNKSVISTFAFLDSGASENFIDIKFCTDHKIPTLPLPVPLNLVLADSNLASSQITHSAGPLRIQIGTHVEEISPLVGNLAPNNFSFGIPWFTSHDPSISWKDRTLTLKSPDCFSKCQLLQQETVKLIPSTDLPSGIPSVCMKTSLIAPAPVPPTIPPELMEFSDVFRKPTRKDLPKHSKYDHKFELFDETDLPPARPIYSLAPSEKDVLRGYTKEALECGWIIPSKSPIASPIFFVSKKDGGLRPCVDYRGLNTRTKKNKFPLPLISELLARLTSKTRFTKIDLRNAFHQVRIYPGQEWLTAFRSFLGHFEYQVMPFGLTNAPAVLQNMMNDKFSDMRDFVVIYLDDILIFSDSETIHLDHVKRVLRRLRENNLIAKLEKCFFFLDSVEFLGFIVSKDGVSLAADKLSKIRDWPRPQNQLELRSFLGFCNYYRDAVRGYSDLATPLTSLTKKSLAKFEWTDENVQSFKDLKKAILEAPTRPHPDHDKEFILETDASDFALAAVLLQKNKDGKLLPVLFHSRKFNQAERNYSVYDRELLAIVEAFTTWRHYLIAATDPIKIYTDHNNLVYFSRRRPLSPRHSRWVQILSSYSFVIIYRPGSENVLADPLSRHPSYALTPEERDVQNLLTLIPEDKFLQFPPDTLKNFSQASSKAMTLRSAVKAPAETIIPQGNPATQEGSSLSNEDLSEEDEPEEIFNRTEVSDPKVRLKILQSRHDSPLGGHFGQMKTFELIHRDFKWKGLRKDVKKFVSTCEVCQRCKKGRHLPYGLLMPLAPPKMPWISISLDFIVGLPESEGYNAVLVVVDRFTKMAHFIACTDKTDAAMTANFLISYIFKLHGLPDEIISDRGPQFKARLWKQVLQSLKITRKLSTAYHPETDGQTERINQILEQYLRCYINYSQDNWFPLLSLAEFAYNNGPNDRGSPFFLNYGYHPRMDFLTKNVPPGVPPSLDAKKLELIRARAHQILLRAAENSKKYSDRRRKDAQFRIGQDVFISTANMSTNRPSKKLDYKKIGPYPIIAKINDVAFKVKLPRNMRIHPVFHVSLLEPAFADPDPNRKRPPPPPLLIDAEFEYVVEGILDSRYFRNKLQYLVKWQGFSQQESTWEAATNLRNSANFITEFHETKPNAAGPSLLRG